MAWVMWFLLIRKLVFAAVVHDLQPTDQIKLISNLGVEQQVECKEEGEFHLTFAVSEQIFLRVEAWRYFAAN